MRTLRTRLHEIGLSQTALAKVMAEALPDRVWDQSRVNKFLWREIPIDIGTLDVAARAVGLSLLELVERASVGTVTRLNISDTDSETLELLRRLDPSTATCLRGILQGLVVGSSRKRLKR